MQGARIDCVGALLCDSRHRLLLVRRAHAPARGTWSVPGGRVEAGETDHEALVREVREETHLQVRLGPLVGVVERAAPGGAVYVIRDYRCVLPAETTPDSARAGTDAEDVMWCPVADVHRLDCAPGLVDALRGWRVIP